MTRVMTRGRATLLSLALISISACVHTPAQRPESMPSAGAVAPAAPAEVSTQPFPPPAAPAAEGSAPVAAEAAVPPNAAQAVPESQVALTLSPAPPVATAAAT